MWHSYASDILHGMFGQILRGLETRDVIQVWRVQPRFRLRAAEQASGQCVFVVLCEHVLTVLWIRTFRCRLTLMLILWHMWYIWKYRKQSHGDERNWLRLDILLPLCGLCEALPDGSNDQSMETTYNTVSKNPSQWLPVGAFHERSTTPDTLISPILIKFGERGYLACQKHWSQS